jgi:hypothetical protein
VIASALHSNSAWTLDRFLPEWEIRETLRGIWQPVVPDALLQVTLSSEVPQRVVRAAVEIDLGTERRNVLVLKLRSYRELLMAGDSLLGWGEFGLVLVLGGWSSARQRDLGRLLDEHWGGWWMTWPQDGDAASLLAVLKERGEPITTDPHYGCDSNLQPSDRVASVSMDECPGDCHEQN